MNRLKFVQSIKYYSTTTMSSPVVGVKEGKLRGARDSLLDGTAFYSFRGIPYAEPPVGALRFQAPVPKKPWIGIQDATEHGPVCHQPNSATGEELNRDENCLFLNVYTKNLQPSSKLPVMVYIHGGLFLTGSGNDFSYGPKFLLQHDIVLVTLNYRLEVLGFLCLDTPEVPGNAGMKDQVAALRWVQNNIESFGGDPNNVTIFGESSGAASVTYHMISPMSQGLFHKAIAQSGNCICDWSQGQDGRERAIRAAKHLKKETDDVKELEKFFRNAPAKDLVRLTFASLSKDEKYRGLPIHFGPVVEKKFNDVEAFLTKEPIDLIMSNRISNVPFMTGYTSAECIMMLPNRLKKLEFYNKNPHYDIPREIAQKILQNAMDILGERIKNFYVGDKDFTQDDLEEITKMLSDISIIYNTHRFMHLYSKISKPMNSYMYEFNFESALNVTKNEINLNVKGVCHMDELYYLFSSDLTDKYYEKEDKLKEIVWKMTKMWTDFAKTSDPTPDNGIGTKWLPYTTEGREYFKIDEVMETGTFNENERIEFWNNIYSEAGLPCIGTEMPFEKHEQFSFKSWTG